jgi:hypothetical protein
MGGVTIRPVQWTQLQDLRDVDPLGPADLACMAELREVLVRHGRIERFALHLVHRHFEIGADEVVIEYSDPHLREQVLRVARRDGADVRTAIPTTWMLADERPLVTCVCAYRDEQGHLGRHRSA